ncbi:MAG: M3 family metallopeptidase [Flavobacteriaceae bacterium]
MNYLIHAFDTPLETAPFDRILAEHYIPAFEALIPEALQEIEQICSNSAPPNFENTIGTLEKVGSLIDRNSSLLFNLNSAQTSPELQQVAQQAAPILAKFQNDIFLNHQLFEKIQQVYNQLDQDTNLSAEQRTLVQKNYKAFVRNGSLLSEDQKEKLREIDQQLAQKGLLFGEHVLADTNAYELHLTTADSVEGLPENILEAAQIRAQEKNKEGWLFGLDYPSYIPFMKYAKNRALRKKLYLAFGSRGFQSNDNNNSLVIQEILELRYRRAHLLGYENHAAFVLEERMAESPKNTFDFLENLFEKAQPAAQKEWEELSAFTSKNLGLDHLEKWDVAFASERLKEQNYNLDQQQLKVYFALPQVKKGLFTILERLFGLTFHLAEDLQGYHPEVEVYRVMDHQQQLKAVLYTDFHPRAEKRSGAWMTSYRKQQAGIRPHISVVCNFSRPTKSQPALLTFDEVTTLFHEFGHAIHGILADTQYAALSGTSVLWDFVELPSQLLENWCYQEEALSIFAKHYQDNSPIPLEEIQKIKASANFQQGLQTLRQLGFGLLDMNYHTQNPSDISDINTFEKSVLQPFEFTPEVADTCVSSAFSHIFQGGYAAGYYSYKWAEVLEADVFEYFMATGIFNPSTAKALVDHILSKGGTLPPMELFENFRGRKPDPDALLRRAGLLATD